MKQVNEKDENASKYIILFLVFAFGMPLICIVLAKNIHVFSSGISSFVLYGIEAMTPTIGALIVTGILGGRTGIRAFLRKSYLENIKIKYILLAGIIPFMIIVSAKLTSLFFIEDIPFIISTTPQKMIIIMWALIAEELGWRGLLQEKLDKYYSDIITPILVGIIWALWHYHFFYLGTMSVPLLLFVPGCIADSFGYYWLTKKSIGNIIPASIWHFIGNLCFNIFLISPEYNQGSNLTYLMFVIYSIIMALSISVCGVFSEKAENKTTLE